MCSDGISFIRVVGIGLDLLVQLFNDIPLQGLAPLFLKCSGGNQVTNGNGSEMPRGGVVIFPRNLRAIVRGLLLCLYIASRFMVGPEGLKQFTS